MDLIIPILGFLFFIGLGFFCGGMAERKHLQSLDAREAALQDFTISQLKTFPGYVQGTKPPAMFVGEAVIATDYLKSFLAMIRNIFGGEVKSYQSMLNRARREATLRLIEEAHTNGYNAICNLRLNNADVGGSSSATGKNKGKIMACILASATAYHVDTQ